MGPIYIRYHRKKNVTSRLEKTKKTMCVPHLVNLYPPYLLTIFNWRVFSPKPIPPLVTQDHRRRPPSFNRLKMKEVSAPISDLSSSMEIKTTASLAIPVTTGQFQSTTHH
ncbi:unnamed protein product [Lactuca virosa]|uniref:Uncharacterized protein n=1 Tax=Lactuca virosa TaxID=75947 RepID=A0AAU9P441_9ASTR|nr:unnamed protein product [Lactuca virosa]